MLSVIDLEAGYKKGHKSVPVLSSISLQAESNELVAVIGRNGVGKTTLLKTIVGIHIPYKGSIQLNGRELIHADRKYLSKLVSYVSTDLVRSPVMTVNDLVSLGRHPHTSWLGHLEPFDKQCITKAIEYTHMGALANKVTGKGREQ